MSNDPVVIALRNAISINDSVELRLALGKHLLATQQAAAALLHFEAALAFAPSDQAVLNGAIEAAKEAGENSRAQAYQLALQAQSSASPSKLPLVAADTGDNFVQNDVSLPSNQLQVVDDNYLEQTEPDVSFSDVGGLDDVKKRLHRSFLMPLKQPEMFARYGKKISGGLILYGPPGCGKTFIAKALAGELGARFMSIGIADVLDMYVGESERKLHELFETARSRAPTLLFFDEVDALGQRRTQLRGSAGRNVVNQLLAELDGMQSQNQQVFVLGATNQPWDLDPAIRRPGRFDRMVFIPPPDKVARKAILELKLASRPTSPQLNISLLAEQTTSFSGADLEALVNAATELAIEQAIASNTEVPINDHMLQQARHDMRPSTRPWLEISRNYARYANEGGSYDELYSYLQTVGLG